MTRLRASWFICVLCNVLALFVDDEVAAQQTAIPLEPKLEMLLEPAYARQRGTYVQGQIRLTVRLISPHPFEELQLDIPEIAHASLTTLTKARTRRVKIYGHVGYVYETDLALFPQRSGTMLIPEIRAYGVVKSETDEEIAFDESQAATSIVVKAIDPRLETDWWIVASDATMVEDWNPSPELFREGDTIQRTVTLTVSGVREEQLPPLEQGEHPGYTVVGTRKKNKTTLTKTGVVTEVVQTWDLRIQSADVFFISPITLEYWNAEVERPARVIAPSKRVEPLRRDIASRKRELMADAVAAHNSSRIAVFALLAIPVLLLCAGTALVLWHAAPTRADMRLSRHLRVGASPHSCLRVITQWAGDTFDWHGARVIHRLQAIFGKDTAAELTVLQRALYSDHQETISPRRLAKSLRTEARRTRLKALWASARNVITQAI